MNYHGFRLLGSDACLKQELMFIRTFLQTNICIFHPLIYKNYLHSCRPEVMVALYHWPNIASPAIVLKMRFLLPI